MVTRTVTLNVPEHLYSRAEHAARRLQSSVNEVLLKAVDAALPGEAELPSELTRVMDGLLFLNDEALWVAARRALSPEESARLEELIAENKERLLTEDEKEQMDFLVMGYQRVMLIRAKAAVLLKTRGYDISELTAAIPASA